MFHSVLVLGLAFIQVQFELLLADVVVFAMLCFEGAFFSFECLQVAHVFLDGVEVSFFSYLFAQ